jgi:hypothetical protein
VLHLSIQHAAEESDHGGNPQPDHEPNGSAAIAKSYPLPDYCSGATGQSGRFNADLGVQKDPRRLGWSRSTHTSRAG